LVLAGIADEEHPILSSDPRKEFMQVIRAGE